MGTEEPVVIVVYRLNLGTGTREFVREVYKLASEASPSTATILPLPVKPLRDFLAGRKSYGSYKRVVRTLVHKISSVVTSERAYVGPVAVRYGENTFLSVFDAVSNTEVSRKFIRLGEELKGYVSKMPIVSLRGVGICFLLLDDIFYPEVARFCAESGSTTLISVFPPINNFDPDLVVLAARMRAYENKVNTIVVGGYLKDRSTPTVIIRKDGTVAEIANDPHSELLEIQLATESTTRSHSEAVRRHYAKTIKMLNSLF